jgi:hypothetical protein
MCTLRTQEELHSLKVQATLDPKAQWNLDHKIRVRVPKVALTLQGCVGDVKHAKDAVQRNLDAIVVAPRITVPPERGTPNLLTFLRRQAHKLETTANADGSDSDSDDSVASAASKWVSCLVVQPRSQVSSHLSMLGPASNIGVCLATGTSPERSLLGPHV